MMVMRRATTAIMALTAAVLTSGCASNDPVYQAFHSEVGILGGVGDFGNATMNNSLAMTDPRSFALDLSRRFAQEVPSTVNFAFNSAQLDSVAQDALREQANFIRQFPEVRFRVYGHTDAVGGAAFNQSLGMRRAQTVVAYLTTHGISRSRLEAVVSFGETQPLIVTEGREMRNRRTVTEVSGFVSRHPSVMDGRYAAIIYRDYVASGVAPSTLSNSVGGVDANE
jgi:outer membrane protein OmpA-like peptidoglycan-associated protein